MLHSYGSGVVYSRLIGYKYGPDVPAGVAIPEPDLAESWEQPEADRLTYVFKIRPNAKWQNLDPMNGRAVTAEDVQFSFQRQLDLKVNAGDLGDIASMEAVDDETLRITTGAPNVDFLVSLAFQRNRIVGREVVERDGDVKAGQPVGSGPWIQTGWTNGSNIAFQKNPDYFLQDASGTTLPYADTLNIYRIPDFNTGLLQWREKGHLVLGLWGSPDDERRD